MRGVTVAVSLLFVLIPNLVNAQTSTATPAPPDTGREGGQRLSLQVAAGSTLISGGNSLSAAFGYSPASRLELRLNVERAHLPFQLKRFTDGYSATRGGTMTFVTGEVRLSLLPADRVSPFAMAGIGGGVSRPTVNDQFPGGVSNDLRVLYFGGGVRVPLRAGLSLWGDARAMLALENNDGIMAVWPVRAGVAWRF
jgi:hypothetical protein